MLWRGFSVNTVYSELPQLKMHPTTSQEGIEGISSQTVLFTLRKKCNKRNKRVWRHIKHLCSVWKLRNCSEYQKINVFSLEYWVYFKGFLIFSRVWCIRKSIKLDIQRQTTEVPLFTVKHVYNEVLGTSKFTSL